MTDELAQTTATDDPAVAFEELRRAVALTRVAIEGLTAARERIPDYSDTLGEMLAAWRDSADGLARIERSPAVSLSPAAMAAEIVKAGEVARAADRKQIQEVRDEMFRAIGRIDTIVDHGRAAHHQRRSLVCTAIGAGLGGILFMAVLPGVVARSLPVNWHVPEWMAARTIGLDQREAGERMIETAPEKRTPNGRSAH
jgi:hypothetical protein